MHEKFNAFLSQPFCAAEEEIFCKQNASIIWYRNLVLPAYSLFAKHPEDNNSLKRELQPDESSVLGEPLDNVKKNLKKYEDDSNLSYDENRRLGVQFVQMPWGLEAGD